MVYVLPLHEELQSAAGSSATRGRNGGAAQVTSVSRQAPFTRGRLRPLVTREKKKVRLSTVTEPVQITRIVPTSDAPNKEVTVPRTRHGSRRSPSRNRCEQRQVTRDPLAHFSLSLQVEDGETGNRHQLRLERRTEIEDERE